MCEHDTTQRRTNERSHVRVTSRLRTLHAFKRAALVALDSQAYVVTDHTYAWASLVNRFCDAAMIDHMTNDEAMDVDILM